LSELLKTATEEFTLSLHFSGVLSRQNLQGMVARSIFALNAPNAAFSPPEPAKSTSISSNHWTESQSAKSPMLQNPEAWATRKFKIVSKSGPPALAFMRFLG
jgi:hypothetical protein